MYATLFREHPGIKKAYYLNICLELILSINTYYVALTKLSHSYDKVDKARLLSLDTVVGTIQTYYLRNPEAEGFTP